MELINFISNNQGESKNDLINSLWREKKNNKSAPMNQITTHNTQIEKQCDIKIRQVAFFYSFSFKFGFEKSICRFRFGVQSTGRL